MSVIDYCKKIYLFTPLEYKVVDILIKEYIDFNMQIFNYLQQIDIYEVQFYWYKDSNKNVLGGFHNLSYDLKTQKYAIYINMFFDYEHQGDSFDTISLCFDTILHELKHYHQMKNEYGFAFYMFLQLPIIRNFTIETDAYKVSDRVEQLQISQNMIPRQNIYLKYKYNLDSCYLKEDEKRIIKAIKQKNIDINDIRNNDQLLTYKMIELYLKDK